MNKKKLGMVFFILTGTALILAAPEVRAANFDAAAAQGLADDNECFKCHSIDKTKKGPSFKKIALKYKGKADAEATLVKHLKTGPKVKLEDGSSEDHKIIDAKDDAQVKNLVRWVLSL